MRLVKVENIVSAGVFAKKEERKQIQSEIEAGISAIHWPPKSGSFTLCKVKQGNGVKPIKDSFVQHLASNGWVAEQKMRLAKGLGLGKVDSIKQLQSGKYFAVEWETGNISSSHRALNKLALGVLDGYLEGGALVLPSKEMYPYLTDRIGNFREIEPYFPLWRALKAKGVIDVYVVEHDSLSEDAPRITKGTDGRALR